MAISGLPPSPPAANEDAYHATLRMTSVSTPGRAEDVVAFFNDALPFLCPSVPSPGDDTFATPRPGAWCCWSRKGRPPP